MEEWKQCGTGAKRYSKWIYEVSNKGNVRVIDYSKNPRVLKQHLNSKGYFRVNIANKRILVHHLVALHFIGSRPEGMVIDHIDRDKINNNVSNLRYVTHKENSQNSKLVIEKRNKPIKYECVCGSNIQNEKNKINRHERSKKHQNYILSLNK